jgi:hypothetical protein
MPLFSRTDPLSNWQSESCYDEHVLRSPVIALLPWRFYHHAIPKRLSGAIAHPRSIPRTPLRTPALARPIEFSRGPLKDFLSICTMSFCKAALQLQSSPGEEGTRFGIIASCLRRPNNFLRLASLTRRSCGSLMFSSSFLVLWR